MNQFKVLLYNGNKFVDISRLIEANSNLQDKLDLTLDYASFVIPHAKQSYTDMEGIDFSKPIKPWMPLILDINNGEELYRFYTTNCTRSIISKGTTKRYKHEISVVEASKSLFGKPIPDMTITQPKSNVFTASYFSDSRVIEHQVKNTLVELPMTTVNNSINPSIINNRTIKAGTSANIYFTFDFKNEQYTAARRPFVSSYTSSASADIDITVYANGNPIATYSSLYAEPGTSRIEGIWPVDNVVLNKPGLSTHYRNTHRTALVDETITVKARTKGTYTKCSEGIDGGCSTFEDTVDVSVFMTIAADTGPADDVFRYLDKEVIKILDSVNITYGTNYYLSPSTQSEISRILAPEFTFQSYTAWDALEKLANYVDAIPEVGLNNYSEVSFRFVDEEPDIEYNISQFTDETTAYTFDDYNTGLEINAANVIEEDSLKSVKVEPYIGGWMTPRVNSNDIMQFTENNAAFKTRQKIYKVYKMLIKGPQIILVKSGSPDVILSGNSGGSASNLIYGENTYWDISDLTVEAQKWNTFENGTKNTSDSIRVLYNTKGNHIYYKQGSNYIEGLAYKTDTLSDLIGTPTPPRALFETIMKSAAIYLQFLHENGILLGYNIKQPSITDNPEIAIVNSSQYNLFKNIYAQIQYIPMANVRSTVYRYDAFNKGVDIVKYSNEQDRLNDTTNLGQVTTKTINKLGNMIYTVSGQKKDYSNIPKLGYKTSDGKKVLSRNIKLNKNIISYDLELSENFLNQSSYVGVNSAHRQYEVPADDYVHRQDKYNEFIVITKDKTNNLPSSSNLTQYGKRMLLNSFQLANSNYNKYPISYGKITITKKEDSAESNNEEAFDIPINGFNLGTTINLQLEADTNYSMGPKVEDSYIYSSGAWTIRDNYRLQNFTKYTSELGKFYSYSLELRQRGTINNSQEDANKYPIFTNNTFDSYDVVLFNLSRENVNKDAREKYGLNLQFPVISGDISSIIVHSGFAKYNSLIRSKDNMSLGFAILSDNKYNPGINDLKVDTSRVTIMPASLYNTNLSYIDDIYGITYTSYIEAEQTVYGYVIFEATTDELILTVKEEFYNDDSFGVDHSFSPIYAVHKKSLNTYMYPDTPAKYNVTFIENGGTDIQNQVVWENTQATRPNISRAGYTLDGWFISPIFTEPNRFDFNTNITADITLYAKWNALPIGSHTWERVYTSSYNTQIFPSIEAYTCPSDYISYLPNADLYSVGYIINVSPYRLCNSITESCYQNPIDMSDFQVCEVRQYRVKEA